MEDLKERAYRIIDILPSGDIKKLQGYARKYRFSFDKPNIMT